MWNLCGSSIDGVILMFLLSNCQVRRVTATFIEWVLPFLLHVADCLAYAGFSESIE